MAKSGPLHQSAVAAERALIGATLLGPNVLDELHVQPTDFYDPRHRVLFGAMLELHREGLPVYDPTLLVQHVNGTSAEWVGGLVSDCMKGQDPSNASFYADAVLANSRERRVREVLASIAGDTNATADEMLLRAQRAVELLRTREALAVPPTAEQILSSDVFSVAQATYSTGFDYLDHLLDGGFKARQLTAIAGPPGAGKSALAAQFCRALALQMPVLIISTELDGAEVASRVAAPLLNVRPSEILSLQASPARAAAAVSELPIYVAAMDDLDLDFDALALIEKLAHAVSASAGRMPAVVIDYMQELASDDPEGRRMSVSRVAKQLRRMARRLDTAFVVLSSVNRSNYGQTARRASGGSEDPRAWLAAAKESGDIEYATAVFTFLEVDQNVGPTGECYARLIVAKSRRGMPGFVGLRFHGPTGRFYAAKEAIAEMGSAKRDADLEKRLIVALRAAKAPKTRDELAKAAGSNRTASWPVITRLLTDGVFTAEETRRPDKSGRMQKVTVLRLTEEEAPDVQ